MNKVTLLAVDLAKEVFQVAEFTDRMKEDFNRQIKRKDIFTRLWLDSQRARWSWKHVTAVTTGLAVLNKWDIVFACCRHSM